MKNRLTIHLVASITLFIAATSTHAATLTVTNTNDASSGSLRQAILDANPNDSIVFDIPTSDPGYYAQTGVYTINLTSAGLTIAKNLGISGLGSRVVVRRNSSSLFSVFTVNAGTFVAIAYLTISNGSFMSGGGIHSEGLLVLDNCTFSGNQAPSPFGGQGGGLYCNDGYTVTVRNCTFSGNEASFGGAIFNHGGALILSSSTISGNIGTVLGGGVENFAPGTTQVRNTIIAGNTDGLSLAPDVSGAFTSDGYNFIGVAIGSTGFGNPGAEDQVGTLANPLDPKLGPLLDHGGDTATMAPLLGSLVIDQGKRGTNPDETEIFELDQRGFPRPVDQASVVDAVDGDGSDVGAVELSEYQFGSSFTVTTTDDHDDAACGLEDCTLREALNAANQNADANAISFGSDIGETITNVITPSGLVINQPVTINGPGARLLTISGGDANRCLQVIGGTVVISGLTFAHGSAGSTPGGAIQNTTGAALTLNDCSFSQNNVVVTYGGAVAQLGAGILNVNRCTFTDNHGGLGGGLGNFEGTVVVTNSTFTGNSALYGGAIASSSLGALTSLDLRSSTVVGNEATTMLADGGGVRQSGGTVTVTNSIIAANTSPATAPNVSGTFLSQGSNVIGDPAGGMGFIDGANGDQVGVTDPKVGALGNHGGPTDTMPLLANSAAINHANAATAPERDQRGYVRPDAPDVGAFEFGGTIPVTLGNISTRLRVETGDNVLIGGFIVTGTEAKKVIVRALGPSLGVAGSLGNPTLELYDASGLFASNDNWKATQKAAIEATTIPPPNDLESAIVATLPANNSAYTAIVRGVDNTTGVGLVEIYDLDRTVDSKLANISSRGLVQTGDDVMIGGLIVLGPDAQRVIVRAIGPSLDVTGKLANPALELYDADGKLVAANDDWRSDQEAEIIATTIPPSKDLESAIVQTLAPAPYTAIVRGVGNTTGIALVEVYELN